MRFAADFTLVAPCKPPPDGGRLIVEAVNRGRRRIIPFFNRAPAPPIDSDAIPEGDGFLQPARLLRPVHRVAVGCLSQRRPDWPGSARSPH